MTEQLRPFTERLAEFCELKKDEFTLVEDTGDFIVFETVAGNRFQCSGYSIHQAMLENDIK